MVTIEDLLTIYWSQVTLVLLGLGFLLKRSLDLKTKKFEINHTLFQQKRLETVSAFFENYTKAEVMWTSIAIWDILNHRTSAKELDQIIFPHINELKKNVLELQIYFKKKDQVLFEQIVENVYGIKHKLSEVYFEEDSKRNIIHKSNDFQSYRDKKLKENKSIFEKVTLILKETFE